MCTWEGEHGFIARKMQVTLKTAAGSQQEDCWPNTLTPQWLLMPEGKEEFPICRFKDEERRQMGSGPELSCWRTYCCGVFVLQRLINGILDFPLVDAAEHLKNSGLELGMAEGNNLLEVLTVLSECVSELILKTDLGGKVKKKVGWKGQKLLRGKEDEKPELTWGKRGTLTLLKYFKRSGPNKSTLFSRSTTTLKQMTITVFFPVIH